MIIHHDLPTPAFAQTRFSQALHMVRLALISFFYSNRHSSYFIKLFCSNAFIFIYLIPSFSLFYPHLCSPILFCVLTTLFAHHCRISQCNNPFRFCTISCTTNPIHRRIAIAHLRLWQFTNLAYLKSFSSSSSKCTLHSIGRVC